jgi:hypothetical protein
MDSGQQTEPVMKSQDIVILLKLVSLEKRQRHNPSHDRDAYSVRSLADALGISKSEISNSIIRSSDSGLASKDWERSLPKANIKALFEFIVYGLKYVFPAKPGPMARGLATSFAAPTLSSKLMSAGESRFVWPYAEGSDSGQSIEPLFKSVPFAAQHDEELYAYLALADAIRLGNPRETQVARGELDLRLQQDG